MTDSLCGHDTASPLGVCSDCEHNTYAISTLVTVADMLADAKRHISDAIQHLSARSVHDHEVGIYVRLISETAADFAVYARRLHREAA